MTKMVISPGAVARYTVSQRIYEKFSFPTRRRLRNGRI